MPKYINEVAAAPQAIGPYSQVVLTKTLAFLSGQIPINPATGKLTDGAIEEQTKQVLANIQAVLTHLGLDFSKVAKTTIFLTDLAHFKVVNEIYSKALGAARPARSTVQVAALPLGAQVEIEMIAEL